MSLGVELRIMNSAWSVLSRIIDVNIIARLSFLSKLEVKKSLLSSLKEKSISIAIIRTSALSDIHWLLGKYYLLVSPFNLELSQCATHIDLSTVQLDKPFLVGTDKH